MTKSISTKSSGSADSYGAVRMALLLLTIAINVAVLVYVVKLEQAYCKCIRDWRHELIKYFALIMIVLKVFRILGGGKVNFNATNKSVAMIMVSLFMIAILVVSIINAYAVFTYVRDLNETNCACAVSDMKKLNMSMLIIRWYYIVAIVISVILIIKTLYDMVY